MRHRIYGKHLGRNKDERDILFKGLIQALFSHGTILTSDAKAKSIKGLVDKVINLAKAKNTRLQAFVNDKSLRERLVKEIVPKLGNRTSGYTSLVKLGSRVGDQTMMVKMSLIGAEELKPVEKVSNKKPIRQAQVKQETSSPEVRKPAARRKLPSKAIKKVSPRKITKKKTK